MTNNRKPQHPLATIVPALLVTLWYLLLAIVTVATVDGFQKPWLVPVLTAAAAFPIAVLLALRLTQTNGGSSNDPLATALQNFVNEAGLSESAKRVLHRKDDRELLRRAIEQDIIDQDFDAALVLVTELADRFGYRADAEAFRQRIERAKSQTTEEQISTAIADFHALLNDRRWNDAYQEAGRIQRLFGDHHRTSSLRHRVDEARVAYRKELERRFLEHANNQEADNAMHLLKELDQYLSPKEAEPFAEVARGVISKSRENLGSRFKLLVKDHEWAAAVGVGEQIVDEFPNSRMAAEVRELMPLLRQRAKGAPALD